MTQSSDAKELVESSDRINNPPLLDLVCAFAALGSERINNPPALISGLVSVDFPKNSPSIFLHKPPSSALSPALDSTLIFGCLKGMYSLNSTKEITGSIIIFSFNIFCCKLFSSNNSSWTGFIEVKLLLGEFDWCKFGGTSF